MKTKYFAQKFEEHMRAGLLKDPGLTAINIGEKFTCALGLTELKFSIFESVHDAI
jgi:hypothetical protein